jgi:hypothetical protein
MQLLFVNTPDSYSLITSLSYLVCCNRLGYEIEGRVGYSDCFCPTVCYPCAVTQLLNEVASRGPKIISATSGPWLAEKKDYSALGDPCDFFCTFLTCKCETANVFSQLSGVPFWFALCSNFCQVGLLHTQ